MADYEFPDKPFGSRRALKVICIGAGATDVEIVVYEKNSDVGGTWLENRYPGCACDIPIHIYCFTWALNPEWSRCYAPATEIGAYFQKVAKDHDLYKYMKFNHRVKSAIWDEESATWKLDIDHYGQVFSDWCHVLINGSGGLNDWAWPSVPGLFDFKGPLMHTANYDTSFDHGGKIVAIIGNGSSGVQALPAIQPTAKKVIHIVRSPTWILPPFGSRNFNPTGENFLYTEEQKSVWRDNPTAQLEYRKSLENPANKQQYEMYQKDGPVQKNVRQMLTTQMQTAFQDHSELLKLIPDWAVGCRRPSPAPGYIDALTKPNVQVIMDKIQVTQKGIVVNGTEIEVDAIVCATGFNPKFLPQYRMAGRNGVDLETQWYGDGRKPEA